MEACGTAHYWARLAQDAGHRSVLLPVQHVWSYPVSVDGYWLGISSWVQGR